MPGPERGIVERLRAARDRDPHPSAESRRGALQAIERALHRRVDDLFAAERADLNKPEVETLLTEVRLCRDEARHMRRRVARWMRGRSVGGSLFTFPSRQRILPEPRGVVLVIGTWNYPVRLAVGPVLAAIAAGNRVVLKPSERAPATAAALKALFAEAVGDELVSVVEGGRETAEALLAERFDLVFFTGGAAAGRAVMRAAADHLTPVVLELGGKSPAIVHQSANVAAAARRIAWGKFLNAGQTCVAPDFVCVHSSIHDAFVVEVTAALRAYYPDQATLERDYARMIAAADFDRAEQLAAGDGVLRFGTPDRAKLISPPTVVPRAGWDHPAMREEVFGPVLPIVAYDDAADVVRKLRSRPSPLAVYVFAEDARAAESFRGATASGAFMVNDVIRHLSNFALPFGGVGASGFGSYHGYHGFAAFSHFRPVIRRSSRFSLFDLTPPYGALADRLLRWLR